MPHEAGRSPPRLQRIDRQLIQDSFLDIRFWTKTHSTEITSGEYLSEIQSLLNSSSKIALARSLRRREAQTLIDLLDQVS